MTEFSPLATNLTTWGFHDCQRDMTNGGLGGQRKRNIFDFCKFGCALPYFSPKATPSPSAPPLPLGISTFATINCTYFLIYFQNSVYSLYPFFTPQKMRDSLTRQKIEQKYTFDRPETLPVTKVLSTFAGIKTVFNDPTRFNVIYEKKGYGSPLMFDEVSKSVTHAFLHLIYTALIRCCLGMTRTRLWLSMPCFLIKILSTNTSPISVHPSLPESKKRHSSTYHTQSCGSKLWIKLIMIRYPNVSGNYIDIVKDAINPVSAHFVADKVVNSILIHKTMFETNNRQTGIDLKTRENPSGMFTENEFFDMVAVLVSSL